MSRSSPHLALRAVVAIALVAGLAACKPAGDAGGATLRVDSVGDAGRAEMLMRQTALDVTSQGLVQFDAAGQTVPGRATSWRIADDGLSVIFRLRAAKWSDGRPVTAEQVVLSFRRLLAPAGRSTLKPLFGRIVNAPQVASGRLPPKALGISAPVSNVVEIRLSAPMPELLQLLALPDSTIRRSGSDAPVNGAFLPDAGDTAM
ncbi:MAG TPA: ABC transporter substrate-binding protein, partial [Polymorphobacter sp.]|nr:ABC transporter substrate-binding protein [Polymorphobacter sp.]